MKELLDYIGYEVKEGQEPDFNQIKEHFDQKFIAKDRIAEDKSITQPLIDKAYGAYGKRMEAKFISTLKENGLDVTHSEMNGYKNVEELIELGVKQLTEKVIPKNAQIDEKLKKQLEDVIQERNHLKTFAETKEKELNDFVSKVKQKETQSLVQKEIDSAMSKVKWSPGIPDVSKLGLKVKFDSMYKLEPNDEGKIELRDKEGNRVYNPNRATELLKVDSVFEQLAKQEGLWEKSPHDGKTPPTTTTRERVETDPPKTPKLSPNFGVGRRTQHS